jgi:hypothetical protein
MMSWLMNRKDLERSGHGLVEALSWHFRAKTEENHKNLSQTSWCLNWDSNQAPPVVQEGILSVHWFIKKNILDLWLTADGLYSIFCTTYAIHQCWHLWWEVILDGGLCSFSLLSSLLDILQNFAYALVFCVCVYMCVHLHKAHTQTDADTHSHT